MTNTMMHKALLTFLCALPFALGACSGAKEQLGLTKKSPDEFAVTKHAPLAMPPDYGLRPPQPGAQRPQEQSTGEMARTAVFGEGAANSGEYASAPDSAESALLQQAGGNSADPAIRQKVDAETNELEQSQKPVVKKILGVVGAGGDPAASVVDPTAEAERLRKNAEAGKPVTEGETPSVIE